MKLRTFFLSFTITIFASCKNDESINTYILNNQLEDSRYYFESLIKSQDLFIENKLADYPYLQTQFDSLKKIKTEIDNIIAQKNIYQKDSISFLKLKNQIESQKKLNLVFNSLKIKEKVEDTLFQKIIILDLLKAKYEINEAFISRKCNILE